MAVKKTDDYLLAKRSLGIVGPYDPNPDAALTSVDPYAVRLARRLDARVKRSATLLKLARRSIIVARQAKGRLAGKGRRAQAVSGGKSLITAGLDLDPAKMSFSRPESPDVSIVIPVFNKVEYTLHCLKILSSHASQYSFEVVVVNNNSTDNTKAALEQIAGLVLINNDENQGFVDGCNTGAGKATGNVLVFLNNDTEVLSGWLDQLVGCLLNEPNAGLVGSKILYPDGRLQEAGGIIFSDGSGYNYGKNDDANKSEYNYRREVDYCSGASIAINTALFRKLGGFDRTFAPAYYEDTDLAFQVRASGKRVIYEPSSVILHIEGGTAGTNLNSGFKRYQSINHDKFVKKWQATLQRDHAAGIAELFVARDRGSSKIALVVDGYIPQPDRDSGSVRMTRMITSLQDLGYKVIFWADDGQFPEPYVSQLQERGVEVVYDSPGFGWFAQLNGQFIDLVVLSRPNVAAKYIDFCRVWFIYAAIFFDTVDLHFLRLERQLKYEKHTPELLNDAAWYRPLELGLIHRADGTFVVSPVEQKLLREIVPSKPVSVVSNIHQVIETAYTQGYDDRSDLVFIGGFNHTPNRDGIEWFCDKILPLILKAEPTIRVRVIGPNMPTTLAAKLQRTRGVELLGYVEDLSDVFSHTRVFVAPLRYGAGVKGKIGSAVEYGIPVVSTTIGAEGMHLKDGDSCLLADDEKAFADQVIKLYRDKSLWNHIQQAARASLVTNFSPSTAKHALTKAITEVQPELRTVN